MKMKVFSVLAVISLLLVAACGGGDSTEDPSPTASETPPITASPTPEPSPTPTETTPEPTVSDDVEDVLQDMLDRLIVAYTKTDGATAAYQGQNVKTLSQLEQGNAYFVYSVKDVTLELPDDINQQIVKGWQLPAWIAADAPASTTLSEYKDSIYFVIGTDSESDGFKLYISPAVTPLTTIQVGQEYCYITGLGPGNPTCMTRQ